MKYIEKMKKEISGVCDFSKKTVFAGLVLAAAYSVFALYALYYGPHSSNPLLFRDLSKGLAENAGVCLLCGIIAGILCDIIYKKDVINK